MTKKTLRHSAFAVFLLCASVVMGFSQQITLEDIWTRGTFSSKGVPGFNSMSDGKYYSAQDDIGNIIRYSFETGNVVDTLVLQREVKLAGFNYSWSKDETKLLLQNNFKQIYRHSFSANIYVFDRKTKSLFQPTSDAVMLAEFSPDGNKVAYVKSNDLYVYDLVKKQETRITNDGATNQIINGATDWVYEEEFALSKGFYWNTDGSALAYYRFDESAVKEFNMFMYGTLYPEDYRFKYPKAGEANSVIQIFAYNLNTSTKQQMDIGSNSDIYIPRIYWTTQNNQLFIQRLNRLQNKLELLLGNSSNGQTTKIYTEENKAYIEVPDLTFLPDGKSFIINSEKNGWNHLYQYDLSGKLIRQITEGNWDVDQFYGFDAKSKNLFVSTSEVNSTERYVYAISLDGKKKKQLTTRKGWNTATFNSTYTYFLLNNSSINTPPYFALCNQDGTKELRVLENNSKLTQTMTKFPLVKAEVGEYKNAYGEPLNTFTIKPAGFDASKKYPVLMYVYGGPGHQLAVNRWMGANYFWFQLLDCDIFTLISCLCFLKRRF